MALFKPYQDQTAGLQLPEMPVTPQPKGLLASLSGLLAKADNPNDQGLTFWDRLGTVGAGLRDDSGIAQLQAQQNAAKSQSYKKDALQQKALQDANTQADGLGLTGRERLVFMANPEKWAEENAKRYAPATLGAGDARIIPGEDPMYNARTFTAGDQIFNTSMNGAPQAVGTIAPTFADQTARMNAERPDYRSVGAGEQLLEIPRLGTEGYTPSGALPAADAVAPMLSQAIPGLRITGLGRDPSRNADVGGAKNSMHLDNNAIDMVLPPGVTPDQVVAHLRSQGINPTEVLNEGQVGNQGAHLHVGWRPKGQQVASGPRVIATGAPKAQARPATAAEKAAYGISSDVPAQMKPDGTIDVVSGAGAGNRPVPAAIASGYVGNKTALSKLDNAIALASQSPKSFGAQNVFGDDVMQRMDPNGVDARAAVADVAGQVMHDRSGAAVTVGEEKRLKPYIPNPTDKPETIIKKLKGLRQQYVNANSEIESVYGEDNGYRPLSGGQSARPTVTNDSLKAKSSGKDNFIKGQSYTDGDGNTAIYLGNGQWEEQ